MDLSGKSKKRKVERKREEGDDGNKEPSVMRWSSFLSPTRPMGGTCIHAAAYDYGGGGGWFLSAARVRSLRKKTTYSG